MGACISRDRTTDTPDRSHTRSFSSIKRLEDESGPVTAKNANTYTPDPTNTCPDTLESQMSTNLKIFRAIYDYNGLQQGDLKFEKDDKLQLISGDGNDWLYMRHMTTDEEGYAPGNYLVEHDDDNPETQDWWFSLDRREADKQLMLHGNPHGTFLIRASSDKSAFALSIRVKDPTTDDFTIRHYKIRKKESGEVFISAKNCFDSLISLVKHYEQSDGLASRLIKPCPREAVVIPFKEIEVARAAIKLTTRLGQGNFGEVWQGKWNNRVDVAVKTLKEGKMTAEAFLEEAKIMHKLRHRKLVQLMGVCSVGDGEPMYIITELMEHGSLLDYLKKDEGKTITVSELLDMAAQVADGMSYLEDQNFVHRDLRAANILVGKNNVCKVADFGLARLTESVEGEEVYVSSSMKFPVKWTAPEAAYERKFSVKSDVWSFGVLLYELVTYGRIPYPGMNNSETLTQVNSGYRMPQPVNCGANHIGCPSGIYDVMLKCWTADPDFRPTFRSLKETFEDSFSLEGEYLPTADAI